MLSSTLLARIHKFKALKLNGPYLYPIESNFKVNGYVFYYVLYAEDLGGAITVHAFATGFGLGVSKILFKPNQNSTNLHLASSIA